MRKLGILYFVGYLIDLLFSALGTVAPAWEGVSNILSFLLTLASIAVLVLACLNKLQPRFAFLRASGYYLFMVAVGIVFDVAVVLQLGMHETAQRLSQQSGISLLRQQFPWFDFLNGVLLTVWLVLGVHGLLCLLPSHRRSEPCVSLNGGPAKPPVGSGVSEGPPSVN